MSSFYFTASGASIVCSGTVVVCSQYSQSYGFGSMMATHPLCYAKYGTSSPAIYLQPSTPHPASIMPVCTKAARKQSWSTSTRAYESGHQASASTPTATAKTYDNASAPPLESLPPTIAPSHYMIEYSQNFRGKVSKNGENELKIAIIQ
jgi:hypothetical protein